jgi:RHS repeat-associated protein
MQPVSFDFGSGSSAIRSEYAFVARPNYLDGRITQIDSAGLKTYGYDDAFRITGITDTVTPANSYAYGFDSLDRLTSAVKTGTTRGWTYDANGNRLTEIGSAASTYTIASTNNRISSITGALPRTYSYDTAGNVLTYAIVTATYNNRGRMKTLTKGAVTATYVYNALGQFVKQSSGPSGTVNYVYDEAGHLLGEYNSSGALIQETIWMGDTPVATIRPGTPVVMYYVHTDHLNTPRRVSRPSDNKLMWTWYSDAFGTDLPNENPASGGTFKYNLRFPGQLYDSHAGLNQNWNRDYDPSVGRYLQSDPMGLHDGPSTYAYVSNNPLVYIDPKGLLRYVHSPGGKTDPLSGDALAIATCLENCLGREILVSGGSECTPDGRHVPGGVLNSRHCPKYNQAFDVVPNGQKTKTFCCAFKCGADLGLDKRNHWHFQKGGNKGAPPDKCECKQEGVDL